MINHERYNIKLNDIILACFACWPLFWNLWGVFRITANTFSLFTFYMLVALAFLTVVTSGKLKTRFFAIWIVYFLTILSGIGRAAISIMFYDVMVCVCGFLVCASMKETAINAKLVLKCVYLSGIFVSSTILIEFLIGGHPAWMESLYTAEAWKNIVSSSDTSYRGIVPYSASAGCYIISGIAAYYYSEVRGKKPGLIQIAVLVLFLLALMMIQKRGFLVDIALTVVAIWLCGLRLQASSKRSVSKVLKGILTVVGIIGICILSYRYIPFVQENVDNIVERFTAKDTTFSGRTLLYDLAFSLFKEKPILGIGWGQYRAKTLGIFGSGTGKTYEVHNVYLQLLCETGVVGLIGFLTAAGSTLLMTIKKYRRLLNIGACAWEKNVCLFSLYQQFMFLAYAMTGNNLYDYNFLIMYFMGILLMFYPCERGKDNEDRYFNVS